MCWLALLPLVLLVALLVALLLALLLALPLALLHLPSELAALGAGVLVVLGCCCWHSATQCQHSATQCQNWCTLVWHTNTNHAGVHYSCQ